MYDILSCQQKRESFLLTSFQSSWQAPVPAFDLHMDCNFVILKISRDNIDLHLHSEKQNISSNPTTRIRYSVLVLVMFSGKADNVSFFHRFLVKASLNLT